MISLKPKSIEILKQCLIHNRNDLLWILETSENIIIDKNLGIKLQDAVEEELVGFGLNENDMPNPYGLLLEMLIDEIGAHYI